MKPIWFTDGACSGNGTANSKGGFGVVCIDNDTNNILYQYQEFHEGTTNNRMEMMAIIYAIKKAYEDNPPYMPIIITDSAYALNSFTSWIYSWQKNGWKRKNGAPLENLDLIQEYYDLTVNQGKFAEIQKIKGHVGHYGNELADSLATGKILLDTTEKS